MIPSGVNSPVRYFEPYPFFTKKSNGAYIWDEDNNRFIDFCNGYGALLGSLFVLSFVGEKADLGVNIPNYDFSIFLIFPVEVLASAMLMGVIFYVVYTKGLKGFSGVAIGGIVGLDILFLAFISGASMNPARALAPALLSGMLDNLWLYLTAPFVGTIIAAFLFRGKFQAQIASNYE